MAAAIDQDVLIPAAEKTNRSALPLSFQPTMPRPPKVRISFRNRSVDSVSDTSGGVEMLVAQNPVTVDDHIEAKKNMTDSVTAFTHNEKAELVATEEQEELDEVQLDSSLIFHTEYYLTYLRSKAEFAAGNIDPEHQKYLRFGRPDVPQLFADTRKMCEAEGIRRVAVFVCGPSGMVNEVADLSRATNMSLCNSTVRFDCHAEVFDF